MGLSAISNELFMLEVCRWSFLGTMVSLLIGLLYASLQLPLDNRENKNSRNVCLSQICGNIFPRKFLLIQYVTVFILRRKMCCRWTRLVIEINCRSILSVAVMSQIGILTPDWSIAAVPCYSPEWKIGVNDEANKIRICSKIIGSNNFFLKYVINNDILQLCLPKISLY